jgi:hypothetical protein
MRHATTTRAPNQITSAKALSCRPAHRGNYDNPGGTGALSLNCGSYPTIWLDWRHPILSAHATVCGSCHVRALFGRDSGAAAPLFTRALAMESFRAVLPCLCCCLLLQLTFDVSLRQDALVLVRGLYLPCCDLGGACSVDRDERRGVVLEGQGILRKDQGVLRNYLGALLDRHGYLTVFAIVGGKRPWWLLAAHQPCRYNAPLCVLPRSLSGPLKPPMPPVVRPPRRSDSPRQARDTLALMKGWRRYNLP